MTIARVIVITTDRDLDSSRSCDHICTIAQLTSNFAFFWQRTVAVTMVMMIFRIRTFVDFSSLSSNSYFREVYIVKR
jgi:hypothetical protein